MFYSSIKASHFNQIGLFTVAFIGYLTEVHDYLALNTFDLVSLYGTSGINNLLTNTLNRYHPCIFYLGSISLGALIFGYPMGRVLSKTFLNSKLVYSYFQQSQVTLTVSFLALWMGSWWALQEGTWGGWWNWDSSETFGLLVPLCVLASIHSRFSLVSLNFLASKNKVLLYVFIFSYFFIQLNFDLTSHNFGARFFFFFNNNLFFLEVLGFILALIPIHLLFSNYMLYLSYWWKRSKTYGLAWDASFIRMVTSIFITYWVLVSYQPLINYFVWNFVEVNLMNTVPSLSGINFFILLVLLAWILTPNLSSPLLLLFLTWYSPIPLFILLVGVSMFTWIRFSHWLLLSFTVVNWVIVYLNVAVTLTEVGFEFITTHSGLTFTTPTLLTLDTLNVDISQQLVASSSVIDSSWNFISSANSSTINSFTLLLGHHSLWNHYLLATSYQSLLLFLELPLLPTLNVLFWLILLTITCFYRQSLHTLKL